MERFLAVEQKALGPQHQYLASTLNYRARLYDEQGRYAEAESLYLRALEISEKGLGPEHLDVATSLNNLATKLLWLSYRFAPEWRQRL